MGALPDGVSGSLQPARSATFKACISVSYTEVRLPSSWHFDSESLFGLTWCRLHNGLNMFPRHQTNALSAHNSTVYVSALESIDHVGPVCACGRRTIRLKAAISNTDCVCEENFPIIKLNLYSSHSWSISAPFAVMAK